MTTESRRAFLSATAAAALWPLAGRAVAQPQGTVRLVTGFAPGGTTDTICRVVAERLKGGSFASHAIVENRSGANGQLALKHVKAARPDGATLLLTPDSIVAVHPHIYQGLDVDPFADLSPVSLAAYTVDAWAIGPLVPASVRTLQDFLQWGKAHPDQANFGSPGAGSVLHFIGALLGKEAGVDLRHAQYRGSQPAVADVIGGQLAAASVPIGDLLRHVDGGRIRVLATTGRERSRFMPNVPTFTEQGFKSLEVEQWMAFFMPGKTPAPIVAQASEALRGALGSKAAQDALAVFGMEPASCTPAELARLMRADYDRWGGVVKSTGFKFA